MKRIVSALPALLFVGCRYADFTLPLPPGPASEVRWTWEPRPGPVLAKGSGYDGRDALNPSVIRRAGGYLNFYSGFDGRTWRTALAASPDGFAWEKRGPVLSPAEGSWEASYIAANGAALERDGEILYWYQAGVKDRPRIGLARSRDGRQWTRELRPVLEYGPRGAWDEMALGDPYAIREGEWIYLFYLGQDRARRQRLGIARSRDGVRWEKLRANPILELGERGAFDEVGLGEPAVWRSHGWWWMLYTGRDRREHRRMGLARSRDGLHWRRVPPVIAGAEPWNETVVCDATVEVRGDEVRVWYGGGNAPSPDENLNGQIGYGVLRARVVP